MKRTSYNLPTRQAGMISIMVTMIMMVVITLIVLGFAQVSRREQRTSLDRQLSTQAFFAAESGINDARRVVQTALASGLPVPEKPDCTTSATDANYPFNPVLDVNNKVSYTCLLVTSRVSNLTGTASISGASTKLALQSATSPITRVHVEWGVQPTPAALTGCPASVPASGSFRRSPDWTCPYGVLRFELVPTSASMTNATLASGHKAIYFYPVQAAGSGTVVYANSNGAVAAIHCALATGRCQADITGLNGTAYAIKLSSIYRNGNFDITAFNGTTALELQNGQVQIDATGRANEVLRRIQVRLPMQASPSTPDYALQSASSVCKRFQYTDINFTIPGDTINQDQLNPMCRPLSVDLPGPVPCGRPADILMVADTSLSMRQEIAPGVTRAEKLREVFKRFVQNTSVGPTNHEGLIGFSGQGGVPYEDNRISTYQRLTSSVTVINTAIDNLPEKFGTQFIPVLNKARDAYREGDYRITADKVMIFVSDGEANEANQDIWDITNAMRASGTIIYTVGIGNEVEFSSLKGMTDGDKFANAVNATQLETIIDDIASRYQCATP